MKLKDIIKRSTLQTKIINPLNFFVKGISIHSDQVRNNFIFAAIKGGSHHGIDFVKDLLNYNNIAVVLYPNASKASFMYVSFTPANKAAALSPATRRLYSGVVCHDNFQGVDQCFDRTRRFGRGFFFAICVDLLRRVGFNMDGLALPAL